MTFSYNAVWDDTVKLVRTHAIVLLAIVGVFNFLPVLLVGHFFPLPEPDPSDPNFLHIYVAFLRHNLIWYVLQSFVVMIGSAAMLKLVFAREGTVGGAIWYAMLLLPAYSVLLLLTGLVVGVGCILLIVPGIYLCGRVLPAGAAMVAEEHRSPLDALKRSFALTAGRGWAIAGLYFLVAIPGAILILVIDRLAGIAFILAAGQELGKTLAAILLCALNALFAALLTMLVAAIYRAIAPAESKA